MRGQRLIPALALVGLASVWAPLASADAASKTSSGGGHTSSTPPPPSSLSQTSQTVWNNPYAPTWCKAEDDYDFRTFTGSLNGTYSTSYQLCDPSTDYYDGTYWNAGGEGLEADVSVVGQLSSMTITAPDGTAHSAVLMSQSTSKGTTTSHYAVCYVPPYYLSSDTGTSPLSGGVWTMTLSGQISSATWTTRDDMTDVTFQHTYCPASEQNLR